MVNYREILRLDSLQYSHRQISASISCSRDTITSVCKLAKKYSLEWPLPDELSNQAIQDLFYPERKERNRRIPDYEYIHKELAKSGVTLTLLWGEYTLLCHSEKEIPYQLTQFSENYRSWARISKATMRISRKPGDLMEVDWAGSVLKIYDRVTGETIDAYLFVAVLPCSCYAYVEAFLDRGTENWIKAHVHAYQYFGGVTRILVPDNLKTGVIKNTRNEILLNRSYQEMAEHYDTAIIPARVKAPQDKANVEGTVNHTTTWVIAVLRNEKHFSIHELNASISEKLAEYNKKPFQKREGSRLSAFQEEEQSFLKPLPASTYELAVWSTAVIHNDYLITDGKNKYSVPYEFIGHTVDIRYTSKTIEVFFQNNRIASHIRRYGAVDPQVLVEHMPDNHQRYLAWNKEAFLEWAQGIGKSTVLVMKSFLTSVKVEQQSYKTCGSLMKLADRYSVNRIEDACRRALSYTPSPSLKSIQTILKTGQDKVKPKTESDKPKSSGKYGFTRGANYFGGSSHD